MENFVKSRLEGAKSSQGHWSNVDEGTLINAIKFYDDVVERKISVKGIVVNIDYSLTQFPRERYYEWKKRLGAEIFIDDF